MIIEATERKYIPIADSMNRLLANIPAIDQDAMKRLAPAFGLGPLIVQKLEEWGIYKTNLTTFPELLHSIYLILGAEVMHKVLEMVTKAHTEFS
jgi:hypothetical protein